jgi:hypothetical protein
MTSTIDFEPYTSEQLARINDTLRMNLCKLKCNVTVEGIRGQLVFTRNAIEVLGDMIDVLLLAVVNFKDFNESNNPYQENDFGKIVLFDRTWFWKFDYYNAELKMFGHDVHLLTVMASEDY